MGGLWTESQAGQGTLAGTCLLLDVSSLRADILERHNKWRPLMQEDETYVLINEQDSDVAALGILLECSFNGRHLSFWWTSDY